MSRPACVRLAAYVFAVAAVLYLYELIISHYAIIVKHEFCDLRYIYKTVSLQQAKQKPQVIDLRRVHVCGYQFDDSELGGDGSLNTSRGFLLIKSNFCYQASPPLLDRSSAANRTARIHHSETIQFLPYHASQDYCRHQLSDRAE